LKKNNFNAAILFAILFFLCPFISMGQIKPDLDNQTTLIHYLSMKEHPEHPEASAFYIHDIVEQNIGIYFYDTELNIDVALKVFKANDAQEYAKLILPKFSNRTRLVNLKVTTYNLENGVVQTKELNKKALQDAEIGKNQSVQLLNAANLKDGSIIRFQIVIKDAQYIQDFNFQKELPVEYASFELTALKKKKIDIKTSVKMPFKEFRDIDAFNQSSLPSIALIYPQNRHITYKWVRRNISPFIKEAFASEQPLEHVKVNFTVNEVEEFKKVYESSLKNATWDEYNKRLYDTAFSYAFAKSDFLYQHLPPIIGQDTDSFQIAKHLFKYVQDSFATVPQHWANNFQDLIKNKKATAPDLNLLLCALFRHAGLSSDLVYVSTNRKSPLSPDTVQKKDTEIAVRVVINNVSYLCNPAVKDLPFGYLPYRYYNGYARLINKTGGAIMLSPELAKNRSEVEVNISPADTVNNKFKISFRKSFGIYYSIGERAEYKKDALSYKDFYKKILARFYPNLEISNYTLKVDHLDNMDQSFTITAEAEIEMGDNAPMLFLDPFLQKIYNGENPFQKINNRSTEVEMDFCLNLNYIFRFKLNDALTVEELPSKSSLQYSNPATIQYTQNAHYNAPTNTVEIRYNYDIVPVAYLPEEVKDLNAFYTALMKATNQKLLLNKK